VLKKEWQVNSGKGFGRRAKKTAFGAGTTSL
jgi:hypothetical protein